MEEFISILRANLKICSSGTMRVKRREMKVELNFWCKFSSVFIHRFLKIKDFGCIFVLFL